MFLKKIAHDYLYKIDDIHFKEHRFAYNYFIDNFGDKLTKLNTYLECDKSNIIGYIDNNIIKIELSDIYDLIYNPENNINNDFIVNYFEFEYIELYDAIKIIYNYVGYVSTHFNTMYKYIFNDSDKLEFEKTSELALRSLLRISIEKYKNTNDLDNKYLLIYDKNNSIVDRVNLKLTYYI